MSVDVGSARVERFGDFRYAFPIQIERGTDQRLTVRVDLYMTYYHEIAVDVKLKSLVYLVQIIKRLCVYAWT